MKQKGGRGTRNDARKNFSPSSSSATEEEVLECVERALEPLGSTARESIFRLFESNARIKRELIPSNMDQFILYLQRLFGTPAAKTIESAIRRELSKRFDIILADRESLAYLAKRVVNAAKVQRD